MFAPLLFLTLTPLTHALCTFPLHQRHDPPKTHILLHSITDRAHNLVIDVGSHRPPTAWNTYSLLDETHHFAVAGLLDDTRLTIKRDGEDGALAFDVGGVQWSSEGRRGDAAGCETGEWVEGAGGRRVCTAHDGGEGMC